jgi:tRNA(Ile2) C34 agmatinyltransferase TiaS
MDFRYREGKEFVLLCRVEMEPRIQPTCPACGFRVFNRRYPKCESCGTELPESIVYTTTERSALVAAETFRTRPNEGDRELSQDGKAFAIESALAAAVLGAATIITGGS